MFIKDLFSKPVDREIKGVIVVGTDEHENVVQELEEYVVTRELQRHFSDFFSAYIKGINGTTPKMGVWISGFFGSGKSHFLKILSYLLDNKEVNGKKALDYFSADKKITDQIVLSNMKIAAETPTDVILFNIDSKSSSNNDDAKDAIVNVFLKVFNNKLGFYGDNPHLADFERELDKEGRYEEFKEKFEEINGRQWIDRRKDFLMKQSELVKTVIAMHYMSESDALGWCKTARGAYTIDIEGFARRVKEYIDSKGNNHHVVFMVDEMGQYIGDDSKLMLNLQTVTEDLGRECSGKAWVIVTSQQDIDSITQVKGNDFSKIQGRFDTRISMSSANVDEVIKKRILDKNDSAKDMLKVLYDEHSTAIKNKIYFNDSVEKKIYKDAKNFVDVYPFITYQFNILPSVLNAIRTHGSSGKHLSEGERSMLAICQDACADIKDRPIGALIPLYRCYDPLKKFLDHNHSSVIIKAYDNNFINPEHLTELKNSNDVFNINVLKTLFLIKYVREIEANIDNITSLMISSVEEDRLELRDKVIKALNVLVQQMVVQKNGGVYTFLTNDEIELERFIARQHIEQAETINKVADVIFAEIISANKYIYPKFNNRYSFPYNQNVDDRPYKSNQNFDIGLRIITPYYSGAVDEQSLRILSSRNREVILLLPNDRAFLEEVTQYLKIEKFLRAPGGISSKYEELKIVQRVKMRERIDLAKTYLLDNLKQAKIFVNGEMPDIAQKSVGDRVTEAIGKLVTNIYHKLNYIDRPVTESDVRKLLHSVNQLSLNLNSGGSLDNDLATKEVFTTIKDNTNYHVKTSMKALKDKFKKAPYGFVDDDIHYLVAKMFKQGDVAFTVNSESVTLLNASVDNIIDYIIKKQYVEKLLIEERIKIDTRKIKLVKKTIKDVFGLSVVNEEEDTIMKTFKNCASNMIKNIDILHGYYSTRKYPGKDNLENGKELLNSIIAIHEPNKFFDAVIKNKSELEDFAENFDPIPEFFNSDQKTIFDAAYDTLLIYNDSKSFITDSILMQIASNIRHILEMKTPYSNIKKLKDLRDKFNAIYDELLEKEAAPVIEVVMAEQDRVKKLLQGKSYASDIHYENTFAELLEEANNENNIKDLRSVKDKATSLKMRIINIINAKEEEIQEAKETGQNNIQPLVTTKKHKVVTIKDMTGTHTWYIQSEAELDSKLAELRKKLMAELGENCVVSVEF